MKSLAERFAAKVEPGNGCWLWKGVVDPTNGYGRLAAGRRSDGLLFAHVASYLLHVGPVPTGLVIDHICRVRACVRPDHLEPVTNLENGHRGAKTVLTDGHVAEIRFRWEAGETQASIARRYRVHASHVSRVLSGKRWPDLARPVERRHGAAA